MPATCYHLDYETMSPCDIASFGGYRYASDPATRILLFAVARDKEEPLLWDFLEPDAPESVAAKALLLEAVESGLPIYAHNAAFEVGISHYRLMEDVGVPAPHINQWRCTQAMTRRAAAPESLGAAAAFFGLGNQKDTIGKDLIKLFCDLDMTHTLFPPPGAIDPDSQRPLKNGGMTKGRKPGNRKSNSPIADTPILWDWQVKVGGQLLTVRGAWDTFRQYCRQDVRTEQELHARLGRFELQGDILESFQFDIRMNFRGVPVNLAALANARSLVEQYQEKLEARLVAICGLRSGQTAKLGEWLRARGYEEDNLQADTVETVLGNPVTMAKLTPMAQSVLKLRALLSFAALKKIPTMLGAACADDGLVRGTMQWHAARTGRAAGRIIQPQNMKKATIPMVEAALCYLMMQQGWSLDWFEELWDSPLEAIASSIRHFIQPADGKMVLDADYIGVEARIAPWLCGQQDKLDDLVAGKDPYKMMASEVIYHIPYDEVTKAQRTVGKPVELQLGYGTGGRGLRDSLRDNFGVVLHEDPKEFLRICNRIVENYRERYSKYPEMWGELERAAKAAIQHGTTTILGDGKVGITKIKTAGIEYLVIRLPSGRRMFYPHPEVKKTFKKYTKEELEDMDADDPRKERGGYFIDQISFYGKLEGSGVWGRIHTWGSRLFENLSQGIGADLLAYGCIQAEKAGYDIFMIVHDQALAVDNELPLEGYLKALCQKQPWAETFPLEADGAIHPYYLKED